MMKSSKFDKILAIDVETSGLNFDGPIEEGYQIVSIGLIVADTDKFLPIDKLYVEIQWNEKSKWDDKAEKIHGFSKKYLENNGLTEYEAVEKIALFLDKHFGTKKAIHLLGHNVQFDLSFLKQLLNQYELPFKFSHRHVDTFSLSMPTIKTFDSDELFDWMGFEERDKHNSMDDAEMALKSCRMISKIWNKHLNK